MRRSYLRLLARRTFTILCGLSLLCTLWLGHHPFRGTTSSVQAQDVRQLVQTGVEHYQAGNFVAAVDPWLTAYEVYKASQDLPALAIVSENLARAYQQMGRTSEEITYWQQAGTTIKTLGDRQKLGRLLTEEAQAYGRLGQHRRAITLLCGVEPDEGACQANSALNLAKDTEDLLGQVTALGSLGEAYRSSGRLNVAKDYLMEGYAIGSTLGDQPNLMASLLNSLGNVSANLALINGRRAEEALNKGDNNSVVALRMRTEANNDQAIEYFLESYDLAVNNQQNELQLYALLNLIPAYERAGDQVAVRSYRVLALNVLQRLPDAKPKAFAAIKLADFLDPPEVRRSQRILSDTPIASAAVEAEAIALLEQARDIGEAIENPRLLSFALGKLGTLDERAERYEAALEKTQDARYAADQDRAAQDSLYLWEWQLGRIFNALDREEDASQAYGQAVAVLDQIRSDILSANRELQFDFRDTVEPLYRQYADLSLADVPKRQKLEEKDPTFENLETALSTLNSLKVAELQSYFANDCVIVPSEIRADEVTRNTATGVFSTAISGDKLTIILSLPDGSRKVVTILETEANVEATVNEFRGKLEAGSRDYVFDSQAAKKLYQWLIEPFEDDLKAAEVKTLVFVNDGLLRSVPMAALYDGSRYLIENYAVATTPSLTLTTPKKVARGKLNALLLGVSERSRLPGRSFISLPAVDQELDDLSKRLPDSKILLNQDFSIEAVQQTLAEKDYRILHMATHGEFGFAPENNFIVAGAKQTGELSQYNQKLTISQLDALIREINDPTREPIELLTLSACETGIGDNRSTLGLAGVAVRAGVRSAIATLWTVSDESTAEVMANFYEKLQDPALTKAEALQEAQLSMLHSDDDSGKSLPYRWAPFILIGNWL